MNAATKTDPAPVLVRDLEQERRLAARWEALVDAALRSLPVAPEALGTRGEVVDVVG